MRVNICSTRKVANDHQYCQKNKLLSDNYFCFYGVWTNIFFLATPSIIIWILRNRNSFKFVYLGVSNFYSITFDFEVSIVIRNWTSESNIKALYLKSESYVCWLQVHQIVSPSSLIVAVFPKINILSKCISSNNAFYYMHGKM